jgi:putative tricarboxylic transport membrane protein
MSVSNGDPTIFFTRPISLVIMIAALISLTYSFRKFYGGRRTRVSTETGHAPAAGDPVAPAASGAMAKRWLTADRLAAMLTIPIGMVLIFVALQAPRPNIPMVIGPHVWPICVLILLIACAIPLFWRRDEEIEEVPLGSPSSSAGAAGEPSWYAKPGMAPLLTVAGLLVYVLLLEALGFLLCTILLVLYQTRVIQQGHWVRNVATAVIFSLVLYFGMTELLSVRLPGGMLGW